MAGSRLRSLRSLRRSPPVPMEVRNWLVRVGGSASRGDPSFSIYPAPDATDVYRDVVVKATFSEPVVGVDASRFTLRDSRGTVVPASVDQIGDGTWALFPHRVFLQPNETYRVLIESGVCSLDGNCTRLARSWRFTTVAEDGSGKGDTRVPTGFERRETPPRKLSLSPRVEPTADRRPQ